MLCCRQPDGCRIGVAANSVRSQGNKRKGRTTVSGPQPPPHILPARPQRVGAATSQEGGPTERARSGEIFLVVPCYYLDGDRRLIVTLHRPYPLKKLRPFPCHRIGPFAWLPTTTWSTDRRLPPILRRTSGKRGREGDAPPSPSSILPVRCTGHRGPLLDCGLDGQPCGAGKKQRKPGVPCYYLDGDRRVVCRTHRPSLRKEAKGPFRATGLGLLLLFRARCRAPYPRSTVRCRQRTDLGFETAEEGASSSTPKVNFHKHPCGVRCARLIQRSFGLGFRR